MLFALTPGEVHDFFMDLPPTEANVLWRQSIGCREHYRRQSFELDIYTNSWITILLYVREVCADAAIFMYACADSAAVRAEILTFRGFDA